MKKRKTCVFSAIVLLVCMLLGAFSGCNEHEHKFTWYISKQPTCTEDGTLEGICDCGKKVLEIIEASHSLDENGECINCGDGEQPHVHQWKWTTLVEQTCEEEGVALGLCDCGMYMYKNLEKHVRDENHICINCGDVGHAHEHQWAWTVITQPKCQREGFAIGSCVCGAYNEKNLEKTLHTRNTDGVCIICGDGESVIEDGQVLGYNAEKIYQKLVSYGFNGSFDQFKGEIKNYQVTEIKIDSFGTVRVVLSAYGQEVPVFLLNQKIKFKVAVLNQLTYVLRLEINENGILKCTLSDGTALDLGGVEGITPSSSKTVRSLFINQDNLLIATYSDNSFKVIGKIALEGTKIDGAEFIYEKISGKSEYAITGVLNKNLQQIEIPATHRGLPITEIAEGAFYENKNVTKVVLGENIRKIGAFAFSYCENLQTVVLNEGLEQIDDWCFSDCKKLSRIVIQKAFRILMLVHLL